MEKIIDVTNTCLIGLYIFVNYKNKIPPIIEYPFFIILLTACYSQSTSKSIRDYIYQVNIWHLLVLFYMNLVLFFKNS